MKVTIDQEGCIECGACQATCPDVFEVPDDERARIVAKFRKGSPAEGEVSGDAESCVRDAADSCPVTVIHIE